MDTSQTQAAADRLAGKLDALDLDVDERAVLEAIFAAAATSVESPAGDVEGFAFEAFEPTGGAPDLPTDPLTIDLRKAGGGGGGSGKEFLRFTFKTVFVTSVQY
jgi:hypothetical protein